jgi:hypothetical protein
MASILTTLGANTYSPFTAAASGNDYVSRYDPYDDYTSTPLTGCIGDSFSRPIMFRYLQIYSSAGSAGSIDLQIATADDGSGGVHINGTGSPLRFPITTANNDANVYDTIEPLQYAAFAKNSANTTVSYYYGFQKNDTNTFTFRRGATTDSAANPNGMWLNGTTISSGTPAWNTTVIYARIGWYHVPNAPTSLARVLNAKTATLAPNGSIPSTSDTQISLEWAHPSDDGISTSLPFGGIYGYRIAYKKSADSTWLLFGSDTVGSPSGTHSTLANNVPYTITNVPSYTTVTSLDSNTNYDFKVAGLNLVSDRHNGAAASMSLWNPSVNTDRGTRYYGNYTNLATAHTGTNADLTSVRTRIAPPTTSGSYTATGNIGIGYSSNITWGTPSGGGAVTPTWTYAVESGALPPGLFLVSSTGAVAGTPSASGTFTFTISLSNQDYDATYYTSGKVTTATQTIVITSGPKVFNGTSFVRSTAKIWNGTTWVSATTKVYDGSTWKDMS